MKTQTHVLLSGYREYPPIINYFRLRPEFTLSFITFILFCIVVYKFSWTTIEKPVDFKDLSQFEMVELEIPVAPPVSETLQQMQELTEEEKIEEQQLKFGNDKGKYAPSALSAIAPVPKVNSMPEYSSALRNEGVEGVVVVEVGIDEEGNIVYGKIVKKLHPVLDRAVIDWMKTVSFYPATDNDGKPFACKIFWPVRFKLD